MRAHQLSLGYDADLVVDSVDLDLPPQAVTAVVGPNGSGKSTLLRGLARLLTPRAGRVTIDGDDLARLSGPVLARRIGVLPQGPVAPPALSVADLVGRGRFPHRNWYRRWNADDDRAVREALTQVGLLDRAAEQVDRLSGGQRQRAWLAMVLAQDTPYLLLDEPTTYLDLAHAVEVMRVVRTIAHERRRTVVCVLHDLTVAARFADHLVVVDGGRIAAAGAPHAVLTAALLDEVFGLRAHVVRVDGAPAVVPAGPDRDRSATVLPHLT